MRSTVFIVLLLSCLQMSAQECKLTRTTDPYTRETRISSGFVQLEGGSVTLDASKPEIDILFSLEGAEKCFDNTSTAYIFFEGSKSKASIRNGGTMNCEGLFHFIFRNSNSVTSLLNRMMTQKITHIVFTGNNKKETTVAFGPLEQDAVKNFATCIVNEAKALLQ